MKCPPATHAYQTHGKILFCMRCGDVQPLLLADEYDVPVASGSTSPPSEVAHSAGAPSESELTPEQIDSLESVSQVLGDLQRLREKETRPRGAPEQLDLGVRHTVEDDSLVDLSNAQPTPRVPVYEGFQTSEYDEALPDPGL